MVRPPWLPNSANRSSWLRPSAFHQYQVWPQQPQEQLNPFSQYNHVDVGHYVNPNIVQPTTQSQRVTAMKLEISPELPIQPSIQGNKLFVAVPAEARTIGEFKEHVAAILNVSSSVFHFTTGEFRIPDEEVIGILSCVSDQRISVVRSVRNWPASETPSRSRFPPQSIENIQPSSAIIESPPSRISRMRSPPRLTHPLPCRPPRISPKHVPNSSNDIATEDSERLPSMPAPMSFSQMKYRINKQTSDDSVNERLRSIAESSGSHAKRAQESHRNSENGASTSSAGHSHTHSHSIPITATHAENETEQSQSTTPEIQNTDGSCTVYQVSAAATGDASTGKLRLLYCETINDNVNVPGTSTNGLSSVAGPPLPCTETLPKEKISGGVNVNGNSQWTAGVRLQVNNETITSAFASVSTSNSPLNLSAVTKTFAEAERDHSHLQIPNIPAERDLSNDQRQTHSSLSHFNSLSSNHHNLFSRNSRSSFVFGSTSPIIGTSFRSIPLSPTNSIPNDFIRSSSSKNKQQDLFGAPSSTSSFMRAEQQSSTVSSRTPWNIYRTFGIIEPDPSKAFCSAALNNETAKSTADISVNGNINWISVNGNLNPPSSSSTINNLNRSPGIIHTKRRRICAIDSASIVYLNEQDNDKNSDSANFNSKQPSSSSTASTSKHTQKSTNTHVHSMEKRLSSGTDDGFRNFGRSTANSPVPLMYKHRNRVETGVTKNGKMNYLSQVRRPRPKLSKSCSQSAAIDDLQDAYEDFERSLQEDNVMLPVELLERDNPGSSKSNNLILEDIESEDSENNEARVKEDVDVKILCEMGKESAFYKEDRPILVADDITVGSLIVFNEKIGSKDDCDCLVLSKRKWGKVVSIEDSDNTTSYMLWLFSPYMKRRSQMNDKKDYVRLCWDDLVDPRIVVTKDQDGSDDSE